MDFDKRVDFYLGSFLHAKKFTAPTMDAEKNLERGMRWPAKRRRELYQLLNRTNNLDKKLLLRLYLLLETYKQF